jgi:hypothetical protein
MWREDDLWNALGGGTNVPANRRVRSPDPQAHLAAAHAQRR